MVNSYSFIETLEMMESVISEVEKLLWFELYWFDDSSDGSAVNSVFRTLFELELFLFIFIDLVVASLR